MPFDPKLIHQAEAPLNEAGDLQLPDDLLELAAQLGDDAQHLAKVYPAVGRSSAPSDNESIGFLSAIPDVGVREDAAFPGAFPAHIRHTSRHLLRAVALVASLAAVIVGATVWYPREDNQPQPRNLASFPERSTTEVTHTVSSPTANNVEPASPNPQSAISSQQSPPPAAPPAPATRDTFLHEYSGPELEGIYDLIGDSDDDKISI
jgi:hypothetical protein